MKTPARIISAVVLAAAVTASLRAQPRAITNQLVVHLTFDDTLNDDSGRGNNATYVGTNGLAVQPTAPTFIPGKLGKGFQFNTYPDASLIEYATLGYPDDLKFGTNTDFSIAFWIKTDGTNLVGEDPAYIANRNWNSSGSRGWGIFMQKAYDTVRVDYTVTEPSTVKLSVRPNTPANENLYDGAWHHLAVTCARGGDVKIYVDGVLENTSAFPASTATLDTDTLSDNGVPEAVNIGQDGTGTYTQGPGNNPPAESGSSGVTNAVVDDLGIWRRALTDIEVANIYQYAELGTNLFNVPDVNSTILLSFTPNNGVSGVAPNVPTQAIIQDQSTALNPSSVQLYVDGTLVAHTLTKVATTNTITYTSPFLFGSLSQHTNKLVFADNGTPTPARSTNVSVYTVAAWTNLYLGTPLYLETFDELTAPTNPPAVYPAGWTVQNCTDPAAGSGNWSLSDPTSDAYLNWQIVPIDVVASSFNYDDRIRNVNGAIVVNGALISVLGTNNIAFAASDQRTGNQVDYLFTKNYDLSGQTNVWVAFNSMFSQEDYELGAFEYSIDQGGTWLPILYLLSSNPSAVVLTNGVLDAEATMTTNNLQIPYGSCGYGNSYGAFIGVSSNLWGTLAPYIRLSPRGDHVTWHRVEQYRLPMADGQGKVRFRFAFVGANFWDWGIDNFGLYAMPPSPPPLQITSIVPSGTNVTVSWNGTGANFGGLQKATSLGAPNWVDIPGTIGQTNYTSTLSGDAAYYRARRY
jgi:hypothetical protein